MTEHRKVLHALRVDGILDIGANRGQFTLSCRLYAPGVGVVAFEPIPHEAAIFRAIHRAAPGVTLVESALGDQAGTATLHLSASADSSSLLPIGKTQVEMFSQTREVGTITVPVTRLDDQAGLWAGRKRQLLKIDVQGFELSVLRGGIETLRTCSHVYVECSEVVLYEGQALRAEVEAFLLAHGFRLKSRHNEHWADGKLIQADYLFERDSGAA